jgi:deaminated glutathione amidase
MQTLTAAVAQMVSGSQRVSNLDQAQNLLEQAKNEGADLVVLPENFAYFGYRPLTDVAERVDGHHPVSDFLAAQSKALGLWIIAGTAPYATSANGADAPEGKVYAGSSVWGPDGRLVTRYDKCHLFDVTVADSVRNYRESDSFVAGEGPCSVSTPWGDMVLSVCYDLRFPEYYRPLVTAHTTMIAVTYHTGAAHWETLLRARAIENQCFVLAANQGGDHGDQRITFGHSCIISPWGEILAMKRDPGPGLAMATLDFDDLTTLRTNMPVLNHRRFI